MNIKVERKFGNGGGITVKADVIITVFAAIIIGLGGWGLVRISDMSTMFATKTEVSKSLEVVAKGLKDYIDEAHTEHIWMREESKDEREKLEGRLEKRIDKLESTLTSQFDKLDKTVRGFIDDCAKGYIRGFREQRQ